MKLLLQIVGAIAIAFGALFFLQGAGIVHWPSYSTMLDVRIWMLWGGLLAAFGAILIGWARRR
ncbi:hypothetical protein [Sphingomonas sp.]|jgi:hypothetical protein|uniref:hypothetical protein n=1 Tax=Sphingomonas sp. TaxID=28214 RepID=UPI002E34064D|nr:hypothetical protein [Sphingomonas sp.]HEX4694022.1 hypothetical protein [Sphingomonas sp.]